MSAALEHRYERMLSLYPRTWREQHGQVVVGTLLDIALAEGRTDPTTAERVDLAVHGLLTRLSLFLPVRVRDGLAAVAVSTGTAFALVYFWFSGWAPLMRNRDMQRELYSFGPFMNPGVILCALWLVAFVCALLAWNRASKIALASSVVVAIATWTNRLVPDWDGPSSMNLGFLAIVALVALIGTPRSRPRLSAASAAWLTVFVGLYAANSLLHADGDRSFWTRIASPTNLLFAVIVALIASVIFLAVRRRTAAAVVFGSLLPWLAVWVVGIMNDDPSAALAIVLIAFASVLFLIAGAFALRRSGVVIRIMTEAE